MGSSGIPYAGKSIAMAYREHCGRRFMRFANVADYSRNRRAVYADWRANERRSVIAHRDLP